MRKVIGLLVLSLLLFWSCKVDIEPNPIGSSSYEPGENEVVLTASKTLSESFPFFKAPYTAVVAAKNIKGPFVKTRAALDSFTLSPAFLTLALIISSSVIDEILLKMGLFRCRSPEE